MEAYQAGTADPPRLGRYRLVAELGRGGMAKIFLAVTQGLAGFNKLVVIKQISAEFAGDPEFVTMFLDEARLAARLHHPNVVQTNEVGEIDGRHYLVMEYLDGQPLSRIRQRLWRAQETLPPGLHIRVLIDALAGLHHAHELTDYDGTPLNVVHRDATPENVFITYDGNVKVVDFGIAKARDATNETQAGTIKGKISYMAPEQALGKSLDRRTDVFAVGVMLWEAVAGTRMWKGVPHPVILQRLAAGEIPSARALRPDIPEALEAIILKATAPEREARYATAAELQSALEGYLEQVGERPHRRELGELVASRFAHEHAQIRAIVEEQLRALPQLTQGRALPVIDPRTAAPTEPSVGASTPSVYATVTRISSQAPRPSRSKLFAGTVLAAAAAMLVAAYALMAPGRPRATASSPAQAQPAAPPRAPTAKLMVTATPPQAKLFLDDEPMTNPFTRELPIGGPDHRLRVEATGYKTRIERFAFQQERAIELSLSVDEHAEKAVAPAPASTPSKKGGKRQLDQDNPYAQKR